MEKYHQIIPERVMEPLRELANKVGEYVVELFKGDDDGSE